VIVFFGEAADVLVEHNLGSSPVAAAVFQKPFGRYGAYHRFGCAMSSQCQATVLGRNRAPFS
jgi:hypothetical protein